MIYICSQSLFTLFLVELLSKPNKGLSYEVLNGVKFNMFRSIPYSSIPDRYIPYLPEEFLPVWKIRKKRKAGISPLTDHVPV